VRRPGSGSSPKIGTRDGESAIVRLGGSLGAIMTDEKSRGVALAAAYAAGQRDGRRRITVVLSIAYISLFTLILLLLVFAAGPIEDYHID
jgi:hypothetical protein